MVPVVEHPSTDLIQYIFPNGVVVSVGFGTRHYSSHLMGGLPATYEIAVIVDDRFLSLAEGDTVLAYQDLDMVEVILNTCARGEHDSLEEEF